MNNDHRRSIEATTEQGTHSTTREGQQAARAPFKVRICAACALSMESNVPKAGPHWCGANQGKSHYMGSGQHPEIRERYRCWDEKRAAVALSPKKEKEARKAAHKAASHVWYVRGAEHHCSVADIENEIWKVFLIDPSLERFRNGGIDYLKLKDYFIRYGHAYVTKLEAEASFPMGLDQRTRDRFGRTAGDIFLVRRHVRAYLDTGIFHPVVFEALSGIEYKRIGMKNPPNVEAQDLSPARVMEFQKVYASLPAWAQQCIYETYALGEILDDAGKDSERRAVDLMVKRLNERTLASYKFLAERQEFLRESGDRNMRKGRDSKGDYMQGPSLVLPRVHKRESDYWRLPEDRDIPQIREARLENDEKRA